MNDKCWHIIPAVVPKTGNILNNKHLSNYFQVTSNRLAVMKSATLPALLLLGRWAPAHNWVWLHDLSFH